MPAPLAWILREDCENKFHLKGWMVPPLQTSCAVPLRCPACAAGRLQDGQPIVRLPAQAEDEGPLVYTLAEGFSMNIRTSLGRTCFVPLFTDCEHLRRVWVRALGPYQHLLGSPPEARLACPDSHAACAGLCGDVPAAHVACQPAA